MDHQDLPLQPPPGNGGPATDEAAAESPLAAERFSTAADRITRKIDKITKHKQPSNRLKILLFIGTGVSILAIISIPVITARSRISHLSPVAKPVSAIVRENRQPVPSEPLSAPLIPPPPAVQDTPLRIKPGNPTKTPGNLENAASVPAAPATTGHSSPPRKRADSAPVRSSKIEPLPSAGTPGEDETNIDDKIAFYEPVAGTAKSGSAAVRYGAAGRSSGRPVPDAPAQKRSCVKAAASLAAAYGGTLDEVLESNGKYFKIRLTIPARQLEPFKKSLAAQKTIATLSVAAESVADGNSIVILEMHTR